MTMKINIPRNLPLIFVALLVWLPPLHMPLKVSILLTFAYTALNFLKYNPLKLYRDSYFDILLLYGITVVASEVIYERDLFNILFTMLYVLVPLTIYVRVILDRKPARVFENALLICTLIYFAIDLYYAFFTVRGSGMTPTGQPLYFSGDKFQTCYVYVLIMTLVGLRTQGKRLLHGLLVLFGVLYAFHVDCSTGAVIIAVYGAVVLLLPGFLKIRTHVYGWFTGLTVVNYLIVILQIQNIFPFIAYIIQEVLHRDMSMSGRFKIYSNISGIMEGHWHLGYGFTSMHVGEYTGHLNKYGSINMQNGLLQILYTSGLIGLVLYLILLVIVVRRLAAMEDNNKKVILIAALSAFLMAAIVEIPFEFGAYHLVIGLIMLETGNAHPAERKVCKTNVTAHRLKEWSF